MTFRQHEFCCHYNSRFLFMTLYICASVSVHKALKYKYIIRPVKTGF